MVNIYCGITAGAIILTHLLFSLILQMRWSYEDYGRVKLYIAKIS